MLARLRAFYREPGAVFWVYGFPLLMVVALGIAFRSNPVEKVTVDMQAGPEAEQVRDALLSQSTGKSLTFAVQINDEETSRRRLRTGKTDLVVLVHRDGSYQYRLDKSRAESRLARTAVHEALQQAAGRTDPVPTLPDEEMLEPGSRYIDFLVPGPRGHGPHGRRHVGRRLRDRRHANPQAAQALRRDADAPQRTSSSAS